MVFGTPAHNGAAPFVVVVEKTELAHGNVGNAVTTRRAEAGEAIDVGNVAMAAVRSLGLDRPRSTSTSGAVPTGLRWSSK